MGRVTLDRAPQESKRLVRGLGRRDRVRNQKRAVTKNTKGGKVPNRVLEDLTKSFDEALAEPSRGKETRQDWIRPGRTEGWGDLI